MGSSALRTILVPLSGPDEAECVLDAAFGVARRFNSHVRVWHVARDPEEALHAAGMALPGSARKMTIEAGLRRSKEIAEATHALFRSYCNRHKITLLERPPPPETMTASWHESVGRESVVVANRGRLADLIVVPRPSSESPAETFQAALFETGQPVLVAPERLPSVVGSKIAIAWNGSLVAARAVIAASSLLAAADRVTVLSSAHMPPQALSGADVVEELAWHGIVAESKTFEVRSGSAGKEILAEAHKLGTDLLIAGGFGHSQVREMILGGATRYFLGHSDLPLLLVH